MAEAKIFKFSTQAMLSISPPPPDDKQLPKRCGHALM